MVPTLHTTTTHAEDNMGAFLNVYLLKKKIIFNMKINISKLSTQNDNSSAERKIVSYYGGMRE